MWLASHEGDSYDKDQGYPGKTAESDHGCKPDKYFNSYMAAARRFIETHDKDPSGYAITICGRDSYPIEEISGLESTTDYAITTAGKNDEFWNKYLLDDRKKVQKQI